MPQLEGRVSAIYTSPAKGLPMRSQDRVTAVVGKGLAGDRYSDVSFIATESIFAVNDMRGTGFQPEDTRRNIVTRNVDLNLEGVIFQVGETEMIGIGPFDSCERPSHLAQEAGLVNREGFGIAFADRGGLRAEIIKGGLIETDAPIVIPWQPRDILFRTFYNELYGGIFSNADLNAMLLHKTGKKIMSEDEAERQIGLVIASGVTPENVQGKIDTVMSSLLDEEIAAVDAALGLNVCGPSMDRNVAAEQLHTSPEQLDELIRSAQQKIAFSGTRRI